MHPIYHKKKKKLLKSLEETLKFIELGREKIVNLLVYSKKLYLVF